MQWSGYRCSENYNCACPDQCTAGEIISKKQLHHCFLFIMFYTFIFSLFVLEDVWSFKCIEKLKQVWINFHPFQEFTWNLMCPQPKQVSLHEKRVLLGMIEPISESEESHQGFSTTPFFFITRWRQPPTFTCKWQLCKEKQPATDPAEHNFCWCCLTHTKLLPLQSLNGWILTHLRQRGPSLPCSSFSLLLFPNPPSFVSKIWVLLSDILGFFPY